MINCEFAKNSSGQLGFLLSCRATAATMTFAQNCEARHSLINRRNLHNHGPKNGKSQRKSKPFTSQSITPPSHAGFQIENQFSMVNKCPFHCPFSLPLSKVTFGRAAKFCMAR